MSTAIVLVMGVSGSGKTTIAAMLAGRLGWYFVDADDLHPLANISKMRSGRPLDDADRIAWLKAVAGQIDTWWATGQSGVIACSALKRQYRDILISHRPQVRLVYLKGTRDLIASRLAARQGHFMPAALLESQFTALEEPGPDERPIIIPITDRPAIEVESIIAQISIGGESRAER